MAQLALKVGQNNSDSPCLSNSFRFDHGLEQVGGLKPEAMCQEHDSVSGLHMELKLQHLVEEERARSLSL
ncbi:hypothetical protein CR513_50817, partial [Mucuna pruriens]